MIYYRKATKKQKKDKYKIVDIDSYPINEGKVFLSNAKKYYILGIQILQKKQFYIDLKVNLQIDIERKYRQGLLYLGIALIIDNDYDNPILFRSIEISNLYVSYNGFFIYNLEKEYDTAHVVLHLLNLDQNYTMIPLNISWGELCFTMYNKN